MLSPQAIKAIVAAVLLAASFATGWLVNGWRISSHTVKAQVAAVKHEVAHERAQTQATAAVEASAAQVRTETQTVYRTINHEVIRYVQSPAPVCTLDSDWVRIYNAAATGTVPEPASGGNAASAARAGDDPRPNSGQQGRIDGDGGQLPDVSTGTGSA